MPVVLISVDKRGHWLDLPCIESIMQKHLHGILLKWSTFKSLRPYLDLRKAVLQFPVEIQQHLPAVNYRYHYHSGCKPGTLLEHIEHKKDKIPYTLTSPNVLSRNNDKDKIYSSKKIHLKCQLVWVTMLLVSGENCEYSFSCQNWNISPLMLIWFAVYMIIYFHPGNKPSLHICWYDLLFTEIYFTQEGTMTGPWRCILNYHDQ